MATAEFSRFAGILSAKLSQHRFSEFETAQLEMIPTGISRQGGLDEQPRITWLLVSLWALKRQGIKPSALISSS